MDYNLLAETISFIRPKSIYILRGEELEWLDDDQIEPTKKEIEEGLVAYKKAQKAEAEAKAQAKAAAEGKLAALGLTNDDLRALGL